MNSTLLEVFRGLPSDPVYLPLLGSPLAAVLIVSAYLLLVFKIGRDFMECRKPCNVRSAMLKYNICQIVMNGIFFAIGSYYLFVIKLYDFHCMVKLPMDHPHKSTERLFMYLYFLNKVLDLADTVFFVLRKSYKQVTVLHVYHHVLMVLAVSTTYYLYGSGGQYYLMGYMNSFVHMVMYSYYYAAALYPEVKNKLWLKQSITIMQITQFVILFAQAALTWGLNPGCSVPRTMHVFELAISFTMMVMFGNFYYQTYVKARSKTN